MAALGLRLRGLGARRRGGRGGGVAPAGERAARGWRRLFPPSSLSIFAAACCVVGRWATRHCRRLPFCSPRQPRRNETPCFQHFEAAGIACPQSHFPVLHSLAPYMGHSPETKSNYPCCTFVRSGLSGLVSKPRKLYSVAAMLLLLSLLPGPVVGGAGPRARRAVCCRRGRSLALLLPLLLLPLIVTAAAAAAAATARRRGAELRRERAQQPARARRGAAQRLGVAQAALEVRPRVLEVLRSLGGRGHRKESEEEKAGGGY